MTSTTTITVAEAQALLGKARIAVFGASAADFAASKKDVEITDILSLTPVERERFFERTRDANSVVVCYPANADADPGLGSFLSGGRFVAVRIG